MFSFFKKIAKPAFTFKNVELSSYAARHPEVISAFYNACATDAVSALNKICDDLGAFREENRRRIADELLAA